MKHKQRGRKTPTKQLSAMARDQVTTSPQPRANGTAPRKSDIETPNGRYSRREWRAMSEFDRYWAMRAKFLWPADMQARRT
jgi:hypothetical protein